MISERIDEYVSLRLAGPEDESLVSRFFESLSETTKQVFPGFAFTREHAVQIAAEAVGNSDSRKYFLIKRAADSAEQPIMLGMVWFWDWTLQVPWLGIMIADAYQNAGYGKKMLGYAIEEARNHVKGGILLTTHKTNVRAQSIYERYKFQVIGEDPRNEILMILRFPSREPEGHMKQRGGI